MSTAPGERCSSVGGAMVAIRKFAEVHDEFGWLADCEVSAERPQVDGQRIDGVGAGVENAAYSSTASTVPTARVRGSIRSPRKVRQSWSSVSRAGQRRSQLIRRCGSTMRRLAEPLWSR